MTTPSLPETLARLAQLLPERVRVNAAGDEIRVRWGVIERRPFIDPDLVGRPRWRMLFEHWGAQGWVTVHDMPEQWLEAALREECDTRGWHWDVGCGRAEVGDWDRLRVTVNWHDLPGGTPAHALVVAVLRWIETGGRTS